MVGFGCASPHRTRPEPVFDHAATGWPLEGVHARTACGACHRGAATTPTECVACHHDRELRHGYIEPHNLECERCHDARGWRPMAASARFDHAGDGGMVLSGSHLGVACGSCHSDLRFDRPGRGTSQCEHCHASPHRDRAFDRRPCEWCHSPALRRFATTRFAHGEHTAFALGRVHEALACTRCHASAGPNPALSTACEACHAADSPHGARFAALGSPPRCATCHDLSPKFRSVVYDHGKQSVTRGFARFHRYAGCHDCHRGRGADFERFAATVACTDCHAHTTVHDNRYRNDQCLRCHVSP